MNFNLFHKTDNEEVFLNVFLYISNLWELNLFFTFYLFFTSY